MGLDDSEALRVLRDAFREDDAGPAGSAGELVHRFYTHWFALDGSVRDLFPPEMSGQRAAFAKALHWVYGELVDQRAQEPVAFLAQLGRDHRKYGLVPGHYDTMWFNANKPGRYHLFCAEYCGTEHSGMVGWVTVMTPSDYQNWLAGGGSSG